MRVCHSVILQFLCSYVTFPLYALVMQMGSHMKKVTFEEQTTKALKNWQRAVRERRKHRRGGVGPGESPSRLSFMSRDDTPSRGSSLLHLLHKHKHHSSTTDMESVTNSPQPYYSETEMSENEGTVAVMPAAVESRRWGEICLSDFSFSRS